ncbi:MAG: uroporphyrinogen decarboxylase [Aquificaceae bacterium]|nr:uroporphyrinogen decarboxylase [Aquificaceae bacterium]MCS7278267.1 uroporphyrinogen decarboxylase [Aquificaceae bacterium]MDW8422994.1 uroporphyrinogen decarboxylase [Aquificaceae bacterium]
MLLIKSLQGERIERFPLWLMRQAGRYMPQYRALREQERDFLAFCKNVELAVRASLLPVELLGVDAVIIFSDILVPLEPAGIGVEFSEGEGPRLQWDGKVESLKRINFSQVEFVGEIIRGVKTQVKDIPVIGFCGAPFTLMAYAIEGGSSKDFKKTKLFMWQRREECRRFVSLLVDNLLEYLKGQIRAGADVVQIFDSWAMHMPYEDFEEYAQTYLKALFQELKSFSGVPLIYFFRGSGSFLKALEGLPVDALSVDWTVDMVGAMRESSKAFQGNLDPAVLYCHEDTIVKKTHELLRCIPRKTKYVFNLGHGLMPDMDLEKVRLLVRTVKEFRLS